MKNKAIVAIGSNHHRTDNIREVQSILRETYPEVRFSTPEITEPIGLPDSSRSFLNLVAVLLTEQEMSEVKAFFKQVEKEMGRNDEDTREGIVPIDIDIIEWNDEVYKPQDMVRSYIVSGMSELDEF